MEQKFDEITRAALMLPISERFQLVERLNESLSEISPDQENDAWLRLAVERLEEVRSGNVDSIDGTIGLREMRERVRG